jgi:hypothetical protein
MGIRKPPQHSNLFPPGILIAHEECAIVPAVLLVCPSTCLLKLISVRMFVLCNILLVMSCSLDDQFQAKLASPCLLPAQTSPLLDVALA